MMSVDTGLAAHLSGLTAERFRIDPALVGPLLENFVAMELRKQSTWNDPSVVVHHVRTLSGQEVDLVIEDAVGRIVGLEVKAASSVAAHDFRGLLALKEMIGDRFHRGAVLYTGKESLPFGDRLHALPVSALWRLGAVRTSAPSR